MLYNELINQSDILTMKKSEYVIIVIKGWNNIVLFIIQGLPKSMLQR